MFAALPQLLPETLSSGQLLLILLFVAGLDAFIIASAASLGFLFVAFKAGKAAYDTIDKLADWLIYTAFRLAEDVLESPPLNRVPFFQLVLVGVKKAYDIVSGSQKLVEFAINAAITALAAALMLLCALALALLNLAAIGAAIYYIK